MKEFTNKTRPLPPIISVVGKTNSGKTTLIEKILPELKARGYRVATIKHDAHNFAMDYEGKDTWRHAQAGSDTVVISAKNKLAMIKKIDKEANLDKLADWLLDDVDIIITEGYKSQDKPKIEVFRKEVSQSLLCSKDELLAIASDTGFNLGVPCFNLDDAKGIVDLIEDRYQMKPRLMKRQ